MDVERTIAFILKSHANAERRMAQAERCMKQADGRMDKFDKRLDGISKLIKQGMRILAEPATLRSVRTVDLLNRGRIARYASFPR